MSKAALTTEQLVVYGESRQPALYGTLITFLIINNFIVVSRCYVNYYVHWKTKGKVFIEDLFVILSGICVDIVIGNLLAATHYGLGLHSWRVLAEDPFFPQNLANCFKHVWATMVMTGPTFGFIKLTLLFFYRRLFLVSQKWMRVFWWVNLLYVVLWVFGSSGFYIFQCWPPEWYYLQYYAKSKVPAPGNVVGQCNATSVLHVALPLIFGLLSDVALLLLPLAAIMQLKMARKKKIGLAGVFCIGFIACALELGRILDLLLDTDDKNDASWGVANFLILSVAEECTAVLCACLPVIAPFLWRSFKQRTWTTGRPGSDRRYVVPRTRSTPQRRNFYKLERSDAKDPEALLSEPDKTLTRDGSGTDTVIGKAIPMTSVAKRGEASDSEEEVQRVGSGQILVRTDIAVQVEER